VTNNDSSNIPRISIDVNIQPSPFARADQVKRDYSARLGRLLSKYEHELAVALNVDALRPHTNWPKSPVTSLVLAKW